MRSVITGLGQNEHPYHGLDLYPQLVVSETSSRDGIKRLSSLVYLPGSSRYLCQVSITCWFLKWHIVQDIHSTKPYLR